MYECLECESKEGLQTILFWYRDPITKADKREFQMCAECLPNLTPIGKWVEHHSMPNAFKKYTLKSS